MAATASWPFAWRASTLSTIACETAKLLVSGSGGASRRRSYVLSVQLTCPSGAFLRTILRTFFGSSPAFSSILRFSITCSGARMITSPTVSKPARPAPPGDLVELARRQVPHADAVVLDQAGQQDGADGHVDADAERVRAADDRQQPLLRQPLHDPSVLGQHPGVMHPDAVPQEPVERLAEAGGEPEPRDLVGDPVPLLPARQRRRHERLRPLDGVLLREVHDVDGGSRGLHQLVQQLVQRLDRVAERQRDGTLGIRDDGDALVRPARRGPRRRSRRRRASRT